jgi:predicted nucleic acid-binding protein
LISTVDASFVLSVLLRENPERLEEDLALLTRTKCIAPSFLKLELRHSLIIAERRGRLQTSERLYVLETFLGLPIEYAVFPTDGQLAACEELAAGHLLSLYDSVYLEMAIRHGSALASLDRDLRRAADLREIRNYPART